MPSHVPHFLNFDGFFIVISIIQDNVGSHMHSVLIQALTRSQTSTFSNLSTSYGHIANNSVAKMVNATVPFIGIGVAVGLFFLITAIIAICLFRQKVRQHVRTTRTTNSQQQQRYPPQQSFQTQLMPNPYPREPQRLQNPHLLPNPYQTPHQQYQTAQYQTAYQTTHTIQPLTTHQHQHYPHATLFPSQPLRTYFPLVPTQHSGVSEDHSLRPGASDTISLDELNSFDAKGDDRHSPCPICLDPLEDEPVSTGNCLHLAHTSCLKSWLAKDTQFACPVCRVPVTDTAANIPLAAPG